MMHKLGYTLLFWCASLSLITAQEAEPTQPAIKAEGPLPWQKEKGEKGQPAKEVPPREMLRLRGMDDSVFDALFDGRELIEDENETLNRLMFNLPRFEPEFWNKWCQKEVPWAELAAKPAEHRLQCYVLAGRAKQVERITILKDLVPLYEFTHYYRVTLEIADHTGPVVVCTRQIPQAWKEATQLDQRVAIQAIFLKAGETKEGLTPLYFGAARVGWYPDQPNPEFGVTADQVWLADHGMDIALWDDVRATNGEKILASESECFYQLLHVLKEAKPEQLKTLPAQAFDLGAMLNTPEKLHGQAYHCLGTVRRIQKVSVPESYQKRLGIDHYYMVDVFVPLDKQVVRLTRTNDEKESPLITDAFPTTFCVVKLPTGLQEGVNIKETVRMKGVFYKQWAFDSQYVKQFDKRLKQPAPLLMGLEPILELNEGATETGVWGSTVVMFTIIVGVGIVWMIVWRFNRGDAKFSRQVLRKYTQGSPTEGPITPPTNEASDKNSTEP